MFLNDGQFLMKLGKTCVPIHSGYTHLRLLALVWWFWYLSTVKADIQQLRYLDELQPPMAFWLCSSLFFFLWHSFIKFFLGKENNYLCN